MLNIPDIVRIVKYPTHIGIFNFNVCKLLTSNGKLLLLLASEFLVGISETFLCSMSVPRVKIVPLLDVHQLLILSARKLTYLDSGIFSFVIYLNILKLKLLLLLFNILLESLLILSLVLT
jgi:hypothetical protein